MNINDIMAQLAQYTRLQEETAAIIDGLKDQIKAYMTDEGLQEYIGNEHKCTYKEVSTSKIDTTALKWNMPDIAKMYTRTASYMRFTFS